MIANSSASATCVHPELSVVATLHKSSCQGDRATVDKILTAVESDDFADPTLQHVFGVTKSLVEANAIVDRAAIEAADTPPTIVAGIDLEEVFQCPAIVGEKQLNVAINSVVRSASLRRALINLEDAASDVQEATANQNIKLDHIASNLSLMAEQLAQADVRLNGKSALPSLANDLGDLVAQLQKTHGKEFLGLPTRTLPTFDNYTSGVRGFNLLAAEPGIGKTALGTQIGVDIVDQNNHAAFVFFSFEMSRRDIELRLLSMMSGLHWKRIVFGTPGAAKSLSGDGLAFDVEDRTAFQKAISALKSIEDRIIICDMESLPQAGHAAMLDIIRRAKKQAGVNKAFVLVDSLQAMPFAKPEGAPWSNDIERDNCAIASMLALQRSLNDPLMLISEQNKQGMGKDAITSPRGTARAVYSPDVVFVLRKPGNSEIDPDANKSMVELKIIKGRDGTRRGTIPLEFHFHTCTFTEFDEVVATDEFGGARIPDHV